MSSPDSYFGIPQFALECHVPHISVILQKIENVGYFLQKICLYL